MSAAPSASISSSFWDGSAEILLGAQTEIILCLIGFCLHSIIFRHYRQTGITPSKFGKTKTMEVKPRSPRSQSEQTPKQDGGSSTKLFARLTQATGPAPDHSANVTELSSAVRSMLREGASAGDLERTLQYHLEGLPIEATPDVLASLLESLGRTATAELLKAVRAEVSNRGTPITSRLGEFILRGYLGLRLLPDFCEVLEQLEDAGPLSPVCAMLALRCELCVPNLEAALFRLKGVAPAWNVPSPSGVQEGVLQQIAKLASEKAKLPELLRALEDNGIAVGWTLELLLLECQHCGDLSTMRKVEARARSLKVELTVTSYCALLRAAPTLEGAVKVFDEAISCGLATDELLVAAAKRSTSENDAKLARAVLDKLPAEPSAELAGTVVMLGAEGPLKGSSVDLTVIDLYQKHLSKANVLADSRASKILSEAALKSKRQDLFEQMLSTGTQDPQHMPRRLALLRSLNPKYHLEAARCVINACDTNAKCLLGKLVESSIANGQLGTTWKVIGEMTKAGMKPGRDICVGILKGLGNSHGDDAERVAKLIETMDGAMDEGVLCALIEACINTGKMDLLQKQLKRWCTGGGVPLTGAHAVGCVIRAYGHVKDIEGVWRTWRQGDSQSIMPTRITLGCMVEALSTNGEVESGYSIIHEALDNPQQRHLVNAVIYCSVIKGFSHQKRFDRVWAVYKEMVREKLQFSIVTFNTLIDACARSSEMRHVPELLESMAKQRIEPNVITYSAVMKGYCQENRIDKAFEVMADMQSSKRFMPDEVTYNTILDGCARNGMYERGMKLLEEMQDAGVYPSNFTLSVLVKLMTRCRKTDMAFQMCEELSQKYHLKLNAHVYANLVHSCTMTGDVNRALGVMERMLGERVRPDARTYGLLLRSCIFAGEAKQAAGLLAAALGLRNGVHPRLARFDAYICQPKTNLPNELVNEILDAICTRCGEEKLAVQLFQEMKHLRFLKLDPRLSHRLTTRAVA